ncbi:unnamed protein product [Rotaria socialis]|uniref:RING-type domain-containing protein n=2 Tax=Rotaria socialis TaxID=392032 RepID=A0A820IVV5_9BILA|nr:unnamed protein product [Rotaria socialis]
MACQVSSTPYAHLSSIIKDNKDQKECCVCLYEKDLTVVFDCNHYVCLSCFKKYSISKLNSRQFKYDANIGYSLGCPNGCSNTLLRELHIFCLMDKSNYERYKTFGAEEYVFYHQGVLCPTASCGCGLILDESNLKVRCPLPIGCGKAFCRSCKTLWTDDALQICKCQTDSQNDNQAFSYWYQLFGTRRESSLAVYKKCPGCSVNTEKDGGCNAISCTRCGMTWCWICELEFLHSQKTYELYHNLMSNYNKNVRPVRNNTDLVNVKIGLKLIQIADVDEKNQLMQTHVYVLHEWQDVSLIWSPEDYDGIEYIQMPSDLIWKPDLVLYNNADGDYQITTRSKAQIRYDGIVKWNPPMVYKSYCSIDIQYYPFDIQNCTLKFGTWSYHGSLVNLQFLTNNESSVLERGWDLEDYTPSIEWEILNLRAIRHEKIYACCVEVFLDLTFTCTVQRKPLFYIVNLIVPCVNISVLAVLVFLLPSDSKKKITLSISILVALLVFYLLLIELIPPTSLVIPLLGKYLLFTIVIVNLSIIITIITLNVHFRRHSTSHMSPLLRKTLLIYLPKLLLMERPPVPPRYVYVKSQPYESIDNQRSTFPWKNDQRRQIARITADHIAYIAEQIENAQTEKEIVEEWRFIALIFDRLFLIIFVSVSLLGTLTSLLKAPSLYHASSPIDPVCFLYYPPINDSQWMKKCGADYLQSLSDTSFIANIQS